MSYKNQEKLIATWKDILDKFKVIETEVDGYNPNRSNGSSIKSKIQALNEIADKLKLYKASMKISDDLKEQFGTSLRIFLKLLLQIGEYVDQINKSDVGKRSEEALLDHMKAVTENFNLIKKIIEENGTLGHDTEDQGTTTESSADKGSDIISVKKQDLFDILHRLEEICQISK
jgi:hypothetical protein